MSNFWLIIEKRAYKLKLQFDYIKKNIFLHHRRSRPRISFMRKAWSSPLSLQNTYVRI